MTVEEYGIWRRAGVLRAVTAGRLRLHVDRPGNGDGLLVYRRIHARVHGNWGTGPEVPRRGSPDLKYKRYFAPAVNISPMEPVG